jgi:hypothetical protein
VTTRLSSPLLAALLAVGTLAACEKREDYEPCPMTQAALDDCSFAKLSDQCSTSQTNCSVLCAVTDHPQCEAGPCMVFRFRMASLENSFHHEASFCSLGCDPAAYACEGGGDCKDRSTTFQCADGAACDPSSRRCVRNNEDGSATILSKCDADKECNSDTCDVARETPVCVESGHECGQDSDCYTTFCKPVMACANNAKCLKDADCADGSTCATCQDGTVCVPRCDGGARCLATACPGDAECLPFGKDGGLCVPRTDLNP